MSGELDHIWLDLGDPCWRQIEIGARGWRIVESTNSPVRFRRPHGMLALPLPMGGGSLGDLREFLNVGTDADFCLAAGFCIGALHPCGPYPVLMLHGEQGTAKSMTTRVLRSLIDPNVGALRSDGNASVPEKLVHSDGASLQQELVNVGLTYPEATRKLSL